MNDINRLTLWNLENHSSLSIGSNKSSSKKSGGAISSKMTPSTSTLY